MFLSSTLAVPPVTCQGGGSDAKILHAQLSSSLPISPNLCITAAPVLSPASTHLRRVEVQMPRRCRLSWRRCCLPLWPPRCPTASSREGRRRRSRTALACRRRQQGPRAIQWCRRTQSTRWVVQGWSMGRGLGRGPEGQMVVPQEAVKVKQVSNAGVGQGDWWYRQSGGWCREHALERTQGKW